MSKFYFNVRDEQDLITDDHGVELPEESALPDWLRQTAREVLDECEWTTELSNGRSFEIVNETGELVLTVPFHEVEKRL